MNPHLRPWQIDADDFPADSYASDQLEFLIGYAILAPSSHNSQPWLFRINSMNLELFADRRRALRVVDPYDRELTLSCSAALYNVRVAAEYFGHAYSVELLPDPANPNLLARFHLGLSGDTSSEDILLFRALTRRHTNRQAFREEPVPEAVLEALREGAEREGAWLEFVVQEEARNAVADLVAQADRLQWADRNFRQELAHWIRPKPAEARDGLLAHDLGVQDWLSFAGPALIRTFDRGGGQAARDRDVAVHSPVLAVLGTDTEDTLAWLKAGQALENVLLRARTEEVWASFLNQPIEVPELRDQLAALIGRAGCPQVLLRLGYAADASPSPRRFVREVLIPHKTP
ncbi:MAG: nitroreductase [Verrucomicrobia bacterium]|nr:nitroreductase [Verrucomicrobiota bacterium]